MPTRSCPWNSERLDVVYHASSAGHRFEVPQLHPNLKMEMARVMVKDAKEITAGLALQQRTHRGSTTQITAIQVHLAGQPAEDMTGLNQQTSCAGSTTRAATIQVHQTGQLEEDKTEMRQLPSQCCRLYPLRDTTA